MATVAPAVRVARLGFDHGWLHLPPTFLNLGVPVLLVDHRLLPEADRLGLEPFGTRNPHRPLPHTLLVAELHPGPLTSLWQHPRGRPRQLLAWHRPTAPDRTWPPGAPGGDAVLIVGDTHAIQLGWHALWDAHIGRIHLVDTTHPHTAHGPP